jgi:hypothetical protein
MESAPTLNHRSIIRWPEGQITASNGAIRTLRPGSKEASLFRPVGDSGGSVGVKWVPVITLHIPEICQFPDDLSDKTAGQVLVQFVNVVSQSTPGAGLSGHRPSRTCNIEHS